MSIHNRTLGASEQRHALPFSNFSLALTSGETGVISLIPYPCTLDAAQVAAFSIQSNPNLLLTVTRFIPGAGVTTWNVGSTFAPPNYGTSGVLTVGISLPAIGSPLLLLAAGDVAGYVVGGGSTAGIFGLAGCLVVRPMQDVKTNLFQSLA